MTDLGKLVGRILNMKNRVYGQTGIMISKVRLHPHDVKAIRDQYEIKDEIRPIYIYPGELVSLSIRTLVGISVEESEEVKVGTAELVVTLS